MRPASRRLRNGHEKWLDGSDATSFAKWGRYLKRRIETLATVQSRMTVFAVVVLSSAMDRPKRKYAHSPSDYRDKLQP